MSEQSMEMAKVLYESVCSTLDGMDIKYNRVEEDLVILLGHQGEDMKHELLIAVSPDNEAIRIIERLPFSINPEKATDIAVSTCYVNDTLLTGKFTYDMKERISFELAHIYTGSLVGEETIKRMIMAVVVTVERYDDKFMAVNKGYLKPEDIVNK